MKEYVLYTSKSNMNMFDALIKNQYAHTDETQKEVDRLHLENTKILDKSQADKGVEFIKEYGQQLFDFIKSISEKYFLIGKYKPYFLSWSVSSDDNDDYWSIYFSKGEFSYVKEICGGYAGTEKLENNISQERVLELLKK